MEYIDCFDLLSIDSIILNDPNCHNIRQYYRLFVALGRYYNACIMQFNRIEEWALLQKEADSHDARSISALDVMPVFTDIHFLLISMDKCYKLETQLYLHLFGSNTSTGFSSSAEVSDIRIMRNALEHLEENINKDSLNNRYHLPEVYANNGWSLLEYQFSSLKHGIFTIKDKELHFSKTMFNHIYEHMQIIANEIKHCVDNLNT